MIKLVIFILLTLALLTEWHDNDNGPTGYAC